MTITCWDIIKAVALAIVQLNALTLFASIVLGPVFMLYDAIKDYREFRSPALVGESDCLAQSKEKTQWTN